MTTRRAIDSELLLRLVNATPEEYAAVQRVLGMGARGGDRNAESRFGLRRELGSWSLQFEGRAGVLRDCRAVELVNYMLKNPPDQAMHAAEWENRVDGSPLLDGFRGIGRAEDEGREAIEVGEVGGMIEERTGKNFMGRITLPALKARLVELRAIREDASLPEEERQAAAAELTNLLRAHGRGGKVTGEAGRAVDRVRKQIKALIRELKAAEVTRGKANEVLRAFGGHLEEYLWGPSVGGRKRLGAAGKAGCFTYEPPPGVRWCD